MAEQERLIGSYCPGCGERDLFLTTKGGYVWAYCARLGDTLETSHTSYKVREAVSKSTQPLKVPVKAGEEE